VKIFLSHTHKDKDVVEPIGNWLSERGFDVWIDSWSLTPGDSLIEKVGEGIESSDRLVVFLSPASVTSTWVRKEVASGLVMELAEERGLGKKFVIPALLTACKVPFFLRDKLYADFTNKTFDAACEELERGIRDDPSGPTNATLENRIIRQWSATDTVHGTHSLTLEFGVRISPVNGLHIGVDVGAAYEEVREWFAPPNQPQMPKSTGGVFTHSSTRSEPPIYARKFESPGVTSSRSFYLNFEGKQPFEVKEIQFLDYYDQQP